MTILSLIAVQIALWYILVESEAGFAFLVSLCKMPHALVR
jgi:hypothetical protein